MSPISGEGKTDFIIARRELDEEDDFVRLTPIFLIVGVPEDTDTNEMKSILEKTGQYDSAEWRNYRVLPHATWEDQENWNIKNASRDDIMDWAITVRDDEDLLNCVHEPAVHGTTFDELVGRFTDEKRITLRLPWTMHVALSRAAQHQTLNSFCIEKLAEAIGYKELNEFEASRRKPGRPKKVENVG